MGTELMRRRSYGALFLTSGNFATFMRLSEHCNNECPRDVIITHSLILLCIRGMLFISAWASRCFVQQSRAMRRPPDVERATETVPRFFVFPNLNTLFVINLTESGTVGLRGI